MIEHEHVWVEAKVVDGPSHVGEILEACAICCKPRPDLVRSHCGVCGEKGNHGDVPHEEAVRSRLRDWPKEMVDWLKKQTMDASTNDEEEAILSLVAKFEREYRL